jgi:Major tropism determinant N-terminal domain
VLAAHEPGVESDTKRLKVGDGSTPWTGLSYAHTITFGPEIPAGEWPKFAARALLWCAVAIALSHLQRLAARRALRTEPRVTFGAVAAWAGVSLAYGRRKIRMLRRAGQR